MQGPALDYSSPIPKQHMSLSKGFPTPADTHVSIPPAGMHGTAAGQVSKWTHTTQLFPFCAELCHSCTPLPSRTPPGVRTSSVLLTQEVTSLLKRGKQLTCTKAIHLIFQTWAALSSKFLFQNRKGFSPHKKPKVNIYSFNCFQLMDIFLK